jgi:hypothetical protein
MRRRLRTVSTAFACTALAAIVAAQQPVLDLTQRPANVAEVERPAVKGVVPGTPEVVRGGTAGESRPAVGLSVVLKLDQTMYRWDDPFLYELELVNSSNASILVPWSLDHPGRPTSERAARGAGYRQMSVSLNVVAGDDLLLIADTPERIVAFTSQPDTVKTLAPGDRVVIRGKGRWRLLSETPAAHALAAQLPRDVSVKAVVSLSDRPTIQGPQGSSTPVQVLLQPR